MDEIEKIFADCGVLLDGHFVLSSMRHSGKYLDKANLYKHPAVFEDLSWRMANEVGLRFNSFSGNRIDVVVGPAPIGAVLAQRIAFHLGENCQSEVVSLFSEKDDEDNQVFRQGFEKNIAGKNVLIVDDILTTGDSVRKIVNEVTVLGGKVSAIAVICSRGGAEPEDLYGIPLAYLSRMEIKSWTAEKCPLCKKKIPVNAGIGKGKEFILSHSS